MKKYSFCLAVILIFILLLAVAPTFAQDGVFPAETVSTVLKYDAPTSIQLSSVEVGTGSILGIYLAQAMLILSLSIGVYVWKSSADSSLHSLKLKLQRQTAQKPLDTTDLQ